ncbi:MAG: histidine kinase [Eubacterium sp.]|nr:histidine kinase [Eubacterium sp.]
MTSQVMMWVEIFAVIVLLIPMIEDIRQYLLSHRISRFIILLEGAIICMLIVNIVYVAMQSPLQNPLRNPTGIRPFYEQMLGALKFVFYYASLYFFVCIVQVFIETKQRVNKLFNRIVLGICVVNTIFRFIVIAVGLYSSAPIDSSIHRFADVVGTVSTIAYVLILASMMWYHRSALSSHNVFVISSFVVLPLLFSVISSVWDIAALVQIAMAISMIIIHVSLFRESDDIVRMQEIELTRARIRVLRSQIGPHFLFNTLNAIYVLCEKDPVQAQQAVSDFSEFLRANLDVLENDARIPFAREMEHVEHYLSLEKMRFRGDLNIEKHLEEMNFVIPALTVQPIVENAVNHGIGRKKGGGTVTIRSEQDEEDFIVTISDDGVGFDTSILTDAVNPAGDEPEAMLRTRGDWMREPEDKKHRSIGLKNVRERIELMSDAKMIVDSVPGTGTIVTLRIPKKNNTMFG